MSWPVWQLPRAALQVLPEKRGMAEQEPCI